MIMQKKMRSIWALPLAAFVAIGVGGRAAEAGVHFNVSSTITPGGGYTNIVGDSSLMNVAFGDLLATGFDLNSPGDTQVLTLATVTFEEPNGDPGVGTDDGISTDEAGLGTLLNVDLTVNILAPGGGSTITLNGTAKAGSTGHDAEGWYQLDFSPPYISPSFNYGGASYQLLVGAQTLLFKTESTGAFNPQYVYGTILLVNPNIGGVPEPASLIVWSVVAGIFGVSGLRRRRNRAAA
jgi:hypothetical protein